MTEIVRDLAFPTNGIARQNEYVVKNLHNGIQVLIRFPNGAGASVVSHSGSYGGNSDLWEIAPIFFTDNDIYGNWEFIGRLFNLPGFDSDDVMGWLTPNKVDDILRMVSAL